MKGLEPTSSNGPSKGKKKWKESDKSFFMSNVFSYLPKSLSCSITLGLEGWVETSTLDTRVVTVTHPLYTINTRGWNLD